MSERVKASKAEPWTWAPIDEAGAVRWEQSPETGEWEAAGLVLYGRVDAARLKAVKIRDLPAQAIRIDTKSGAVPTEAQIREAAAIPGWEGFLEIYGSGTATLTFKGEPPVKWHARVSGEPAEDFYIRTAALFTAIQRAYPKSATTHLAEVTEAPYTTAVRWVRECRRRGYLPTSSLQRARQKDEGES